MKMKRLVSIAMALLLISSLPVTAFAADWYLEDGDITVSADSSGQTVSQGDSAAVTDAAPVITQRDSTTATANTVTVSTTGDAVAEFTIRDVNISTSGDAIDVGNSNAEITLEGENKLYSESGSAVHVSGGDLTITGSGSLEAEIGDNHDNLYSKNNNAKIGSHENEDMSGSIHITGDATVTMNETEKNKYHGNGAGIGSGEYGEMSGSITIDENADVYAFSELDGAGIGSGFDGEMSGNITISGDAKVTGGTSSDGAGIGSGDSINSSDPKMTGTIIVDGNARVTAWSKDAGAGIGSGEDGVVSGTIIIGGNAQVTAGSGDYGNENDGSAGIGSGEDGFISPTGRIIIRDSAKVTAIGKGHGCGIGTGDRTYMRGAIIIQDNAQVTAIAGFDGAAIGSDSRNNNKMTGSILILGNARVTTGVEKSVIFNYTTGQIEYTLNENAIGRIGDGEDAYHESNDGHYVIGPNVTINGVEGSNTEALKEYVNMRLSGENHDGEPENLTLLDIKAENGAFTVTAEGEGSVENILYCGSKTVPTEPGEYPVTLVLRLDDETTIEFEIGTLVIPEPEPDGEEPGDADTLQSPLYRVLDKDEKDIAYKAEQKDGVLTVTVDADFAVLTGTLGGISTLKAQGVEKLVFVTKSAKSTFALAYLLEKGSRGETYKLTHDGKTVTFTLGAKMTDVSTILEKA